MKWAWHVHGRVLVLYQSAGAPGMPLPGAGTSTAFLSSVRPTHCSTSRASRSISSSDFSNYRNEEKGFITTHSINHKEHRQHSSHASDASASGSCNTGPWTHLVCWWFSWFVRQGTPDVWSVPPTSALEHSWDLPPENRQRLKSEPAGSVRQEMSSGAQWYINRARWGWSLWGSTVTAP